MPTSEFSKCLDVRTWDLTKPPDQLEQTVLEQADPVILVVGKHYGLPVKLTIRARGRGFEIMCSHPVDLRLHATNLIDVRPRLEGDDGAR